MNSVLSFLQSLPFGWFDLIILAVLGLGLQRGRKHGMSEELMPLLKWVAIIVVCGLGYSVIGDMISDNSIFTKLSAYMMAYTVIALFITVSFLAIKKMANGKLVGSDIFGCGEYYLGMVAGVLRYSCMIIFAMAFLNAPLYTKSQIDADLAYQNDVYGSDYFPKLYTVQSAVFDKSLLGSEVHNQLGFLLIKSTPQEYKDLRRPPHEDLP